MNGPPERESPGGPGRGEEGTHRPTLSIPRRPRRVKRYPPSWQPYVEVDDAMRDSDLDFPIAAFSPWPWGAP